MKNIWILFIFIWAGARFEVVLSSCISNREYVTTTTYSYHHNYYYNRRNEERDYSTNIICTNIKETFPSSIECNDSKCKSVIFKMCNISIIPTNAFMEARSLKIIEMTNSGIRNIETGAFLGLLKVEEIHLDMNNIQKISRGSFNSLINLKILNLSGNSIKEVESESFHGSSSIINLDLSFNELISIPQDLMKPLTQLESLNISNNLITSMNGNLCYNLLELRYLILDNNKIIEFDECIEKLYINKLSLSQNLLSDLSNVTLPNTLEDLRLDNNNISILSDDIFKNLTNLQVIDLANNSIKNQSMYVFKNIEQLQILNISYNDIDHFDPEGLSTLKQLKTLNIKGNSISILQKGIFRNISSIETLDLSENNISFIPLDVLSDFKNLKILNISGNSIEYLESGVFNELISLRILDISGNVLESLKPHIFFPLTKLEKLNIAHNNLRSFEITDIIVHCPSIKSLDIDGNKFSCNELANIFLFSKEKKFSIVKGSTVMSENVNGIACLENETLSSNRNGIVFNDFTKFFEEDFKNSTFYKFFRNFRVNQYDNEMKDNTTSETNEFKDLRNMSQSFISELSSIVNNIKTMNNHENFDGNFSLLISDIDQFLKNETLHFDEIVMVLSRITNELKMEHEKVVFNISKLIKMNNSMSQMPHEMEQYFMKNSSLNQSLEKLILINRKLEEQLHRNADKFSNFTSALQENVKMKPENFSSRNSIFKSSELTEETKDKKQHASGSSEAQFLKNDSGKILVIPEIQELIGALNQLKLFIILSMLLLMASFSVHIFRYFKRDFYQRRKIECSSLELPIMDK
ncbi:hypothetical protein WA026_004154 [Henosepilachna vigintioctopunctata]|uniref:Uncharacterized protein n=1 Tax=Henosepilachna vigintioctopunctata TaxID=420089 RepID=A0AAW1UHV5_9CUCU